MNTDKLVWLITKLTTRIYSSKEPIRIQRNGKSKRLAQENFHEQVASYRSIK